jgi:hypothetical protein
MDRWEGRTDGRRRCKKGGGGANESSLFGAPSPARWQAGAGEGEEGRCRWPGRSLKGEGGQLILTR